MNVALFSGPASARSDSRSSRAKVNADPTRTAGDVWYS